MRHPAPATTPRTTLTDDRDGRSHRLHARRVRVLLIVLALTAGCAGADRSLSAPGTAEPSHPVDSAATTAAPVITPTPTPTLPMSAGAAEEPTVMPDDLLDRVVDALADRESIDRGSVEILRTERATWPNGALGCPEPGQMYTQAIERGYRVVLGVANQQFDYRVTDRGGIRLCGQEVGSALGDGVSAPDDGP